MERKKIIAVDMDDTLVYLMKRIMEHHNILHPDHQLAYEQMAAFKHEVFHPDYDVVEYLNDPATYESLELVDEYVIAEMKKLNEKYDVLIVTSAFPNAVPGKWAWMQKNLPFIPQRNFITASRKDLINADILIDDAIHNVVDWSKTGRPVLVPSHHWNQELEKIEGVTMIYGWHGVTEIIDHILTDVVSR